MMRKRLAALLPLVFAAPQVFGNVPNSPTLIGGTIANPADWPASVWITSRTGSCSATVIGPQTLYTAAHCMDNGGSVTFQLATTRYSAVCTHSPLYARDYTADWAVCYVGQPVNVPYESVATEGEAACAVGNTYTLTGYGCTIWGGAIDGRFRYGEARITECPVRNNYYTTRDTVAACSGDSGSAGYVYLPDGSRRVTGIVSRSNTIDTSLVSNTFKTTPRDWLKAWADARSTKVCGIHGDAVGCAADIPLPPDDDDNGTVDCGAEIARFDASYSALKACLSTGS